ncbi:DUF1800 domain-containing protein [Derxia lacustris]|uniref:DUF1800 domain-containing protein n=1 Tax=Derxia lacustris TaxID=764842 RepID=UPI001594496C|nr:DUF1800 family protein [Derxia lacustris]
MTQRIPASGALDALRLALSAALALALAACGGGGGLPTESSGTATAAAASASSATTSLDGTAAAYIPTVAADAVVTPRASAQATTTLMAASDAARLAQQATFGPTEALISTIATQGASAWIAAQMTAAKSVYPALGTSAVDTNTNASATWCQTQVGYDAAANSTCWRDNMSVVPVGWQFYRQALAGEDQLRQRMALALSELLVVNNRQIEGTYAFRDYQQMFRDYAFGNYRDLLREVALSPVMGQFLNSVNNDKSDPNENFAREFLQLFTIGTCQLNHDGSLTGGTCQPNYDNAMVRNYAYALTGWTYPAGGANGWCKPLCNGWQNPRFLRGRMVAVDGHQDTTARTLLNGVQLPASRTAAQSLELVLDSVMNHKNMAPFIARRLIQAFVTSNPSPGYLAAVATAFESGSYAGFGSGTRGDLAATLAAVLLSTEARLDGYVWGDGYGRLREPVQLYTAVLRATEASTDAIWFNWTFGDGLGQDPFNAPSVFNFYAPDNALPGTSYVSPAFGIENASTTLSRIQFLWILNNPWITSGLRLDPSSGVSGSWGTYITMSKWLPLVTDPATLVDRFNLLTTSNQLTPTQRQAVIDAVSAWNSTNDPTNWQAHRVRTAAYLTFLSPQFSIVR